MSETQHDAETTAPETTTPETGSEEVGGGIIITDKAAAQVRAIQDREGLTEHVLRISVVGGGCSGMSYRMGFVDEVGEHDQRFEKAGVAVICDPKSYMYLDGTVIDFTDGLNGQGFTFKNPNAQRTCGCGSSFSA